MVSLIKEGRKVHQKIITWLLNKISKYLTSLDLILLRPLSSNPISHLHCAYFRLNLRTLVFRCVPTFSPFRTFTLVGTVLIMYFITGVFVIDATKVVILLFLVDFVLVAISSDRARPSKHPEGYFTYSFPCAEVKH